MADVILLPHPAPRRGELAAAFLEHADLAATSRRVYRASLAALVDGLGATQPVSDLSGELLERWFRARYGAVAPATWSTRSASLASSTRQTLPVGRSAPPGSPRRRRAPARHAQNPAAPGR